MDHDLLNLAARYGRAPTGASSGHKQGISWNRTYPWLPTDLGEKLVAQVFFHVNEDLLDPHDCQKLKEIADNLAIMVNQGHKVTIQCIGRADVSHRAGYNMDLAERRAKEVAYEIKTQMGISGPEKLEHSGTGETYSRSRKSFWLEDRRVDVIARVEPQFTYKYDYWCNNKDLLRPYIFKTYFPQYWLWSNRKLDYLISQYEDENRRGGSGWVKIRPDDYGKVLEVIEQLADMNDWKKIKNWVITRNREQEITTAYEVEYRKAYRIAYDRAYRDFDKSDFRSSCEFFAIKFGLVPKNTPHAIRPGGEAGAGFGKDYKYTGRTRHGQR